MVGVTIGVSWLSQRDMPIDYQPGRSKIRQNLPAVAYRAKSLGILRSDGRDMPTVAPTISRIATVGEEEAESYSTIRRYRTSFCIDGCGTLQSFALRRPIFKQKKGSATISLGLNYYSMGSSLSPFHDTVSLMK
jgi:hypothetical protein